MMYQIERNIYVSRRIFENDIDEAYEKYNLCKKCIK